MKEKMEGLHVLGGWSRKRRALWGSAKLRRRRKRGCNARASGVSLPSVCSSGRYPHMPARTRAFSRPPASVSLALSGPTLPERPDQDLPSELMMTVTRNQAGPITASFICHEHGHVGFSRLMGACGYWLTDANRLRATGGLRRVQCFAHGLSPSVLALPCRISFPLSRASPK